MALLKVGGVEVKSPSSFELGWQDVSRSDAGRTQDALMHKNTVAKKVTIKVSWSALTKEEMHTILNLFKDEYINVTYFDPLESATEDVTKTFYTGDKSAPVKIWTVDSKVYETLSFDLIER